MIWAPAVCAAYPYGTCFAAEENCSSGAAAVKATSSCQWKCFTSTRSSHIRGALRGGARRSRCACTTTSGSHTCLPWPWVWALLGSHPLASFRSWMSPQAATCNTSELHRMLRSFAFSRFSSCCTVLRTLRRLWGCVRRRSSWTRCVSTRPTPLRRPVASRISACSPSSRETSSSSNLMITWRDCV